MEPGEVVPDGDYNIPKLEKGEVLTPHLRSTSHNKHPQLPYLKYTTVVAVCRKLRNMGLSPVIISAEQMPNNVEWNNFFELLHTFRVLYMWYEGYTWSMNIARALLIYLFYGLGVPRATKRGIRRSPVITVLHKLLTAGRHLFVRNWETNFVGLIGYMEQHPADIKFLDDGGEGEAPLKLLAAVEVGLRKTAKGSTCMGKFAMTSAEGWSDPDIIWRKEETYHTVARKLIRCSSRRHWKNETLEGYQFTCRLSKTFRKRHLPLSRSTKDTVLETLVKDPPEWATNPVTKASEIRKRKKSRQRKKAAGPKGGPVKSSAKMMIYDEDIGDFVEPERHSPTPSPDRAKGPASRPPRHTGSKCPASCAQHLFSISCVTPVFKTHHAMQEVSASHRAARSTQTVSVPQLPHRAVNER